MSCADWFKTSCDRCGNIFEDRENRIIIVLQDRSETYTKQRIKGHYCEKCFNKIKRK